MTADTIERPAGFDGFAHSFRASRVYKTTVEEVEGDMFKHKGRVGRKPFHRSQIVAETADYYIVSPVKLTNRSAESIVSVTLDPGWSLVTELAAGGIKLKKGEDATGLVRPGFGHETVHLTDVDKALNILQDMGRWDIAFRLIMDLLNVGESVPVASVVWEKFPHKSKMLFFTGAHTGIYLGGVMKDVVEKWWAYCGGYHNKTGLVPMPDREEYDDFMAGIRNPFVLAGVDRNAAYASISKYFHPVEWLPEDITAAMVGSRQYWLHDNVIYLADVDGFVLPYWYTSITVGTPPDRIGWDKEMVRKLASHMNLPLLVQRRTDKILGR